MIWLCIAPERQEKTERIMRALAAGIPDAKVITGEPPDDGQPFAVWGHVFPAHKIVPAALKSGRPFWYVDNGFIQPAKGRSDGYYRLSYRGFDPVLLEGPPEPRRLARNAVMRPWRGTGRDVVIAYPGATYGALAGLSMPEWIAGIRGRVEAVTKRPIIIRQKPPIGTVGKPIESVLANAWALVTHSSNVAVDAVMLGVPVFVEPSNPAAPVGNLDLADIERPRRPERERWFASLLAQQYSLDEMRSGFAWRMMQMIRRQVDGV